MAPDSVFVRLEILKVLLPAASRHGITEPEQITKTAAHLADFVLESPQQGAKTPDAPGRPILTRPRKEKSGTDVPGFMTPPPVDKSNQTLG